ncbi:hypothetical protein ACWCQ0_39205 [Streptomyces massasporeus]|uniref:hypothetical protein n=1 Tax=Streptomyces massasporeus TaxID=67324 RepID=UPI0033C5F8CC
MNVPVRAATDLRLLRAAVFSAVCVALSASGHALASGGGIPVLSLAAGWAGLVGLVGPLAGRERSLPGIALTLLSGEIGLHLLFSFGQGSTTQAPVNQSTRVVTLAERLLCGAGSAHLTPESAARILRQARIDPARAVPVAHSTASMAGMPGHGGHSMMLSSMLTLPMLAAHVAAAVLTGWVLYRCEIAVWQAVRLPAVVADHMARLLLLWRLCGLLTAAASLLVPVAALLKLLCMRVPRRAEEGCTRRVRSAVLRMCVVRRGPPAVVAAA